MLRRYLQCISANWSVWRRENEKNKSFSSAIFQGMIFVVLFFLFKKPIRYRLL